MKSAFIIRLSFQIAIFLLATIGAPASADAQVRRATAQPAARPAQRAPAQVNGQYPGQRDVAANRVNTGGRDVNINIDRDINIHNTRNTVVRHNPVGYYPRPPYYWGGRRYYCFHPYHYHPYRPFYWGPVWHPWGFFVATLAATAIIVSANDAKYHYDQGVYYQESSSGDGYTVVQAPVGAEVSSIPKESETVVVDGKTYYYYAGAFYEKKGSNYTVVPPQAGSVVDNLPEGGEEVKIGDQTYVKIGETYYAPVQVDGKDKYEVVQVEEGEGEG